MSEGGWKTGFVIPDRKMGLYLCEGTHKTGATEKTADRCHMSEGVFEGEYRRIASAFDRIIKLHAASLTKVMGVVERDGSGNLSPLIQELPVRATDTGRMGPPGGNLLDLIEDAHTLSKAAVEGWMAAKRSSVTSGDK
jgi:hypothetical protein